MPVIKTSPISGLVDHALPPANTDLLIISQILTNGLWFTGKIELGVILSYLLSQIDVSEISGLGTTIDDIYVQLAKKLEGGHNHTIAEISGLQQTLNNLAPIVHGHAIGQISGLQDALDSKLSSTNHNHTIAQIVGLQTALNQKAAYSHGHVIVDIVGLVDALDAKLDYTLRGQANGLAELDSNGLVKITQLDLIIIEKEDITVFPSIGLPGKLYIDLSTSSAYRWSGFGYTQIGSTNNYVSLGETSTTAYRGDRGKTAYDHSQSTHAPVNAQQNVQSDWSALTGDELIKNKPTSMTPTAHTHTYADISNPKPANDAQRNVQSDWNATSGDELIKNKPTSMTPTAHTHLYADISDSKPPVNAQQNVQSDWSATTGDAFIKNKPTTMTPTAHTHLYADISDTKPPVNAQKNSDILKSEIESVLTGAITTHTHSNYLLLTGGTVAGNITLNGVLQGTATFNTPSIVSSLAAGTIIKTTYGDIDITTASGVSELKFNTALNLFRFTKPIAAGSSSYVAGTTPFNGQTSGYSFLINGLILQWGYVINDANVKSFPIAFPNCCMVINASPVYDGFDRNLTTTFNIINNSTFKLRCNSSTSSTIIAYFALGW